MIGSGKLVHALVSVQNVRQILGVDTFHLMLHDEAQNADIYLPPLPLMTTTTSTMLKRKVKNSKKEEFWGVCSMKVDLLILKVKLLLRAISNIGLV